MLMCAPMLVSVIILVATGTAGFGSVEVPEARADLQIKSTKTVTTPARPFE